MRLNFNTVQYDTEQTITEKNQQLQSEINRLVDEVIDLKDKNHELQSKLNVWINHG